MSYYNDDREGAEGAGFLIVIFIILIPVLPAGDIGLYFAKQLSNKPMVIVNITCWIGFIVIYATLLFYIVKNILYPLHISIVILLIYAQGIIFSFIINDTEMAKFTPIVVEITTKIFNFLTSPA